MTIVLGHPGDLGDLGNLGRLGKMGKDARKKRRLAPARCRNRRRHKHLPIMAACQIVAFLCESLQTFANLCEPACRHAGLCVSLRLAAAPCRSLSRCEIGIAARCRPAYPPRPFGQARQNGQPGGARKREIREWSIRKSLAATALRLSAPFPTVPNGSQRFSRGNRDSARSPLVPLCSLSFRPIPAFGLAV